MADYPISNVPRRVQYVNSGVGPYAFTFEILVQTDIAVYRGSTLLTLTTDYTVTINANGTGSITLVTAGTGNITIVGARAIQRSSDYTTGGDLFASTLNTDLDSQTIYSQQLAETLDRTIKVPVTDASTLNMQLPSSTVRANKVFAFDSNGAPQASTNTLAAIDSAVDAIESLSSAPSGSSAGISHISSGSGAVATTVQAKLRETVSVKDFGAVGNGVADDTVAIQNAINSSTGFLSVYFPTGTYKITSTVTILYDRVMLYGDGSASKILFVPTTNAVCFLFDKGSTSSVQNTVCDLTFYSTDTTYTKTAIKLVDVSQCLVQNIHTIFPHWFGSGSTFLHILGRDSTAIRGLNVFADKPIRVSPIPAPHVAAGIGIDHFHFSDCYLGNTTSANPLITFDDAVIITNVTFDGYQAWVGGSHGFYWNSPTATQASLNLSINNVRWEQAISGGYLAYVSATSGLAALSFTNCYSGDGTSVGAKGYFLRSIEQFAFRSVFYAGPSIGLDADATCSNGNFDLILNDPTSTLNLSAKRLTGTIRQGGNIFNYSPSVPSGSGNTQNWNPSKTLGFSQLEPKTFTVPASSTVTFSEDSLKGLVFIYASLSVSAVMAVNGATRSTRLLVASDAGWFGTSVGAANINLYWDSGSSLYKLQVNIASNITFHVVTMGTGER
jgi:hypothetical protein